MEIRLLFFPDFQQKHDQDSWLMGFSQKKCMEFITFLSVSRNQRQKRRKRERGLMYSVVCNALWFNAAGKCRTSRTPNKQKKSLLVVFVFSVIFSLFHFFPGIVCRIFFVRAIFGVFEVFFLFALEFSF